MIWSLEAEERVLGYLFNPYIAQEDKKQILTLLTGSHFVDDHHRHIFEAIQEHQVFDKIVLWDRVGKEKLFDIKDLTNIDELTTKTEVESYTSILIDKFQKRKVYDFGKAIQKAMLEDGDQFEVALKAQSILSSIGSKVPLESNQELLEQVLTEEPGHTLLSGYNIIDNYIGGYARGMIVTIAGDSGHLKTTFALDKAFRMAEANPNAKIGIFSKEMLATDLMKKQISRICGIPTNLIFSRKYDKEYIKEKMMEIPAWRDNRIRIINPNSFSGVADIARIQMTHKFDVWFLDFIQLLEFGKAVKDASDYNIQVGQNMRNLQALALATKSVGIVLSQIRKGVEYRKSKKPTISDIEWSGLIKQLSSYIFFSYYPGKYYGFDVLSADQYFLIAEKTRFAENFIYPMKVIPELGIFEEITDPNLRMSMTLKLRTIVDN